MKKKAKEEIKTLICSTETKWHILKTQDKLENFTEKGYALVKLTPFLALALKGNVRIVKSENKLVSLFDEINNLDSSILSKKLEAQDVVDFEKIVSLLSVNHEEELGKGRDVTLIVDHFSLDEGSDESDEIFRKLSEIE